MKFNKIAYYTSTAFMSLLFLFSAQMYIFNYEMVCGFFTTLGFPTWIVMPLAIAKILGIISVWVIMPGNSDNGKPLNAFKFLKEWAYAGFFFDVVLALKAHLTAADGGYIMAMIGIVLVILSRYFYGKISK